MAIAFSSPPRDSSPPKFPPLCDKPLSPVIEIAPSQASDDEFIKRRAGKSTVLGRIRRKSMRSNKPGHHSSRETLNSVGSSTDPEVNGSNPSASYKKKKQTGLVSRLSKRFTSKMKSSKRNKGRPTEIPVSSTFQDTKEFFERRSSSSLSSRTASFNGNNNNDVDMTSYTQSNREILKSRPPSIIITCH